MAHRDMQQPRANKPLLPATDPREVLDYADEGNNSNSGSSSRQHKRAKVTAVACQPCQKRKSKCDGLRPTCSSCQQKGRVDCVYDLSSDLRRTSALKQRIDNMKQEVDDLKEILLAICDAYGTPNMDAIMQVVARNINPRDFSRVPELAQVLRNKSGPRPLDHVPYSHPDRPADGNLVTHFQQMPFAFAGSTPTLLPGELQVSPAMTDNQSDWSLSSNQSHVDGGAGHPTYGGNYMYPS